MQEDYYDAASNTWDVDGLEDDLRLAKVGFLGLGFRSRSRVCDLGFSVGILGSP